MFTSPAALPLSHQLLPLGPEQLHAEQEDSWLVAPHVFRAYEPSAHYRAMVARIQRHHGVHLAPAQDCVLIQRRGSRVLHASETGEPLEHWLGPRLQAAGIPWRLVILEELAPLDQWRAMARARLLIGVHGSGLTNLVFTPEACTVLEIDFRRHWSCDPLCAEHRSGRLAYSQPCAGSRLHSGDYHKADYHILCGLFGRAWIAQSVENVMGYRSINPIDVEHVEISAARLWQEVERVFSVVLF